MDKCEICGRDVVFEATMGDTTPEYDVCDKCDAHVCRWCGDDDYGTIWCLDCIEQEEE